MKKSVVITGVSTGIGYGATMEFQKHGYHVFGSVRKPKDAIKLKKEFGEDFTPLIFDITNQKSVIESAKLVEEKLEGKGLAGLINNAGAAQGAPLMHMPIEVFRQHLEVLVVGQLIVTQAFLPLLGANKNCSFRPGKIINISSINGKMPAPFIGGYVASKYALEGLSKTLRIELQLYGIDVIIVGPGIIKTPIWDKAEEISFEPYRNTDYYEPYQSFSKFVKKMIVSEGYEVDLFSKKLVKIFERKNIKTRYAIVRGKFINWTLPLLLPSRILDRFYANKLKFKR